MYNVDSNILAKYASDSREIFVRATFNGTHKVNGDYIKTFTVSDSVSGSNDTLSLGNACSAKLELDMFMPPTTGYTYTDAETGETTTYNDFVGLANAEIKLEVGVEVDGEVKFTPIGVFYIDSYESKNEFRSVKITAFDGMLKIDNALGSSYTCSLTAANPTALDVLKDILTQAGISTAYIGEATSGGSSWQAYPQTSAGIKYSDTGEKTNTNTSIGMNTPFWISATANDIEFILVSDSETFPSSIKVLYFSDANLTNLLSVNNYEVDTEFIVDVGLGWQVNVQTTTPAHSEPIYVVFCADIPSYSASDLKLYIGINQNIPRVTNYVNPTVTIPNPNTVDVSARTMLGYMAGILGCNAKFDRNGHFVLKRIGGNTEIDINRPQQYMDGFQKTTAEILTIGYLTTGSDTNGEGQGEVVTVGSGTFGFNFENPYIPLTVNEQPNVVANTILDLYKNTAFLSGSVKYRYDPSIDCGDIVYVEGNEGDYFKVIVLGHKISMTGGLSATVECNINTDTAKEFVSTPSSKKLTSKFNEFITKYQDIVKALTSVSGGFVKEVRDSNEKVRALAITQSDIEVEWDETNNKVVVVHSYDSSVPMWVWSYGGLSFSNNGGASYEVGINMRGEIYANYLQSPLGYIGGWILNSEKIFQRVKVGTTTYEFTLKSDSSSSQTKKAIYANTFTDNRNSDSVDADSYKTENFFIRRNGEIFLASGSIAGWNIDSNSFYSDYTDSSSNTYRTYIQNAAAAGANSWVFSVQKKLSNNSYEPLFVVKANGEVKASAYKDINGYNLISWNDTNHYYVFGYGSYSLGWDTYLEGGNILLRAGSSGEVRVQKGTTTRLTLGRGSYTIGGSTADRDFINSSGGFVISANGGNNRLHLWGSSIFITSDTEINGDLECGAITATGTVKINYTASAACPVYMTKAGALYPYTSSRRYKENIKYELDEDLNPEKLYDLPVAQYNYKEEYADRSLAEGKQIGLIAEDVAEIYPNAVIKNGEGEIESWQSMIMLPAMLKLIQNQKVQLDEQVNEINDLKARLSALEDIVNKLIKE